MIMMLCGSPAASTSTTRLLLLLPLAALLASSATTSNAFLHSCKSKSKRKSRAAADHRHYHARNYKYAWMPSRLGMSAARSTDTERTSGSPSQSQSQSQLWKGDDDDDDDDDGNDSVLLVKYQRRANVLQDALQQQTLVANKYANRVMLLEEAVKKLRHQGSDNLKNQSRSNDNNADDATNTEQLAAAHKALGETHKTLVDAQQRLAVQNDIIESLQKDVEQLQIQISEQDKQTQASDRAQETSNAELMEVERALFNVEKELKLERGQWDVREEKLQSLLDQEKKKAKRLAGKLAQIQISETDNDNNLSMQNSTAAAVDLVDNADADASTDTVVREASFAGSSSTEHETQRREEEQLQLRLIQEQLEIATSAAKAANEREKVLVNRLTILQNEFEKRKAMLAGLQERYEQKKGTWSSRLREVHGKYSTSQSLVQKYQQEKMDLMEQLLEERLKHAATLKVQADHHEAYIREQRASFDKERKFFQIQLQTSTSEQLKNANNLKDEKKDWTIPNGAKAITDVEMGVKEVRAISEENVNNGEATGAVKPVEDTKEVVLTTSTNGSELENVKQLDSSPQKTRTSRPIRATKSVVQKWWFRLRSIRLFRKSQHQNGEDESSSLKVIDVPQIGKATAKKESPESYANSLSHMEANRI